MARVPRARVHAAADGERADTSLDSKRGLLLRPLDRALSDFAKYSETLRELV
jgi:hypothetical protein